MSDHLLSGRRNRIIIAFLSLALCTVLQPLGAPLVEGTAPKQVPRPEACLSDNPYLATSCYVRGKTFDNEPAIVSFRDSPDDGDHSVLATIGEVGATYGLAYDPAKDVLYAGAFHKRNSKFGRLGPGGIYEVHLDGSGVTPLFKVPNPGRNQHDPDNNYQPDERGRSAAGRTSLGDIDISDDGTELFVMNLSDRLIYRLELPDGVVVGSFDHGAKAESWARDARPFGLKVKDGWVYHGVVNSAFASQDPEDLVAQVYASRPDGTDMRLVAQLALGYDRGKHDRWKPWPRRDKLGRQRNHYPHAMLTDIEFDKAGNLIVGLRDRYVDTGPSLTEFYRVAPGDILLLHKTGDMKWEFDPNAPEHYRQDNLPNVHDEIALGGLVQLLTRDVVVSTVIDPYRTHREGTNIGAVSAGAIWFENASGADLGREEIIYNARRHAGPHGKSIGLGDLELLCGPTPTRTATRRATATSTSIPTVTPTAEPRVFTIYLPMIHRAERCIPDAFYADVVLVLDRSTSMLRAVEEGGRPKNEAAIEAANKFVGLLDFTPDELDRHDQVAIVGFNDTAWTEQGLGNDREAVLNALDRLSRKTIEGTRLDLAFLEGQKPLDGPARKPENRPVLVLLTDGLPNRVPIPPGGRQEDTVLAAAQKAKERGTRIYTVGVGKPTDIHPRLLIAAASEDWMYYYAPRPEDLEGIYGQIAQSFDDCKPRPRPTPARCIPEELHTDVVLVLDMSTSMYRLTRAGRTKHEAALEAARVFVSMMDLERDGWGRQDQVAIVGFNDIAWIQLGLADDRGVIDIALTRLLDRIQEGTRLDLAFREGQGALEDLRHLPENRRTMILLTDGLPNRVPFPPGGRQEDTVLAEAQRAKDRGSRIFTVGLGRPEDIMGWLLEEAATDPSMYYYAPDGEDLAGIYRQIAGRVSECPDPHSACGRCGQGAVTPKGRASRVGL